MTRDMGILRHEDALPAMAREIAGRIGMADTLRIVEALGGTTFPIPKRENRLGELRFSLLEQAVGMKAAEILCRQYGGTSLYIPRCAAALRRMRDEEMIRHFDAEIRTGRPGRDVVAELALRYRISDRRVWLILKGPESAPNRQPAPAQGRMV